jgi:adenosylcobinamide kinase / adenosylcobinamide-phosphate guanylyltransferase
MSIVLVGGGSRSGKSKYALTLARKCGGRLGFLATAQPFDDEMRSRIQKHQNDRGSDFLTIEEPLQLAKIIREQEGINDVLVIDCLTLWLNNMLFAGLEPTFDEVLDCAAASPLRCIVVTNEVGCGIVPENAQARKFRDLAGTLNQQAAASALEVHWMIFGVPLRVK